MTRFLSACLAMLVLLGGATSAWACAICAPADAQNTLSHQLWAAQSAVLARPGAAGQGLRVMATLKDGAQGSPRVLSGPLPAGETLTGEQAYLMVLSQGSQAWRVVAVMPMSRLSWLQQLVALGRAVDTPASAWPKRLGFLVQALEDEHPVVAQSAYEEIAVAPYAAMRTLKPMLDADRLLRWMATPALASRRPLYALLLGMVGNEAVARLVQARLLGQEGGAGLFGPAGTLTGAEVSALLAALIEIRGDAALVWVGQHYLSDRNRPDAELQAVLLALSVHGADGQRLARERIVEAYVAWIQQQKPRAGLVASDLAAWGRWEFGPAFAAILQSGEAIPFASRYAMVIFLMRSPRPEARQALLALQAAGVL